MALGTQNPPDLESVLELDGICLRAPDGSPLDTAAHRAKLAQTLPRSRWAVVRRQGQLVAYAYVWPIGDADWFVGGIAVHPLHRSAPTIMALTRAVAELLRTIDARRLKSHVLRNNTASLRLHRRLGFEIEKESDLAVAFSADCSTVLRGLRA